MTGLRTPDLLPTVIPSVSSKLLRFVAKENDAGKESSNFKVYFSGSLLQGLTMAMEDEGQAKEIGPGTDFSKFESK